MFNGFIVSLFGLVEGRRYDSGMLVDLGDFCKNYCSICLYWMGYFYVFMVILCIFCVFIYEGCLKVLIDISRMVV